MTIAELKKAGLQPGDKFNLGGGSKYVAGVILSEGILAFPFSSNGSTSAIFLAEDYASIDSTGIITKASTSPNTMSTTPLLDRAAIATKGEPARSFIKLGVTDVDGNLTADGKKLFFDWLWEVNAADFKKDVIDPIIAADKADAKAAKDAS